jgi:MFS transporter, AAHS family, 4-hydroxybenzoate transporter
VKVGTIPLLPLAIAVMFVVGFDIFLVGKIAPVIAQHFRVDIVAMTPVFVTAQIGLAIGAVGGGTLSDRFGRVWVLRNAVLGFSILTIAAPFSPTLSVFAAVRGLAGLFLGATGPALLAHISATGGEAKQSRRIGFTLAGQSAGAASGAFVALWLVESIGWQSGFFLCGVAGLLLAATFRYLKDSSSDDAKAEITAESGSIWAPQHWVATIVIGGCFFVSLANLSMLNAWLASLFHDRMGISVTDFAAVSIFSVVGNLTGMALSGIIADHYPASKLAPAIFAGHAAALLAIGLVPFGGLVFGVTLIGAAFLQSAGQGLINILIASAYPKTLRGSGFGFAASMGRVGGIFGPAIGGGLLASALSVREIMLASAVAPMSVAGLLGLLLIFTSKLVSPEFKQADQ